MINEEIARLTGKIVIQADYRPLDNLSKKFKVVQDQMTAFAAATNKKFNIKVALDSKTLKAELDKAANAKITFRNFAADTAAVERLTTAVKERFERTSINLKNVKINMSEIIAQRAGLREQLGKVQMLLNVSLKFKEAEQALRAWKKATEDKFKLYINADISGAKLYRNAAKTLRDVGMRLGTFKVHDPKIRLSVDKTHLKAEIAAVLEQIKREVKIKIDLNGHASGGGRSSGGSRRGRGEAAGFGLGALGGESFGLMKGFLPGLGLAYGVAKLNEINQQMVGQTHAMVAVTGSPEAGAATQKRLEKMGDEVGFNSREMAPSFVKMIASGNASGFGQAKSEKLFQSMTEYGRTMGLTGEEMKGSLRAVEQMMNKDQVMSEELKGQLGERFPAAVALFAKSQKMTTPQLMAAMKAGQIKASALEAFGELLHDEARKGGALALAENATAAQQERMGNAVTKSAGSLSAGGFDKATGDFFKRVTIALNRAQPAIKSFGAAFEILMAPVYAVINLLGKLGEKWPDIAKGMGLTTGQLSALAGALLLFMAPLGPVIIAVGALAEALDDLNAFAEGRDSFFGRWLKDSPEAQKAFDDLKDTAGELWSNIKYAVKSVTDLAPGLKDLKFSDVLIEVMRELKTVLDGINAVVSRFTAAGAYSNFRANAYGEDGTIDRNLNNMIGLGKGADGVSEEMSNWLQHINPISAKDAPFEPRAAGLNELWYNTMKYVAQQQRAPLDSSVTNAMKVEIKIDGTGMDPMGLSKVISDHLMDVFNQTNTNLPESK